MYDKVDDNSEVSDLIQMVPHHHFGKSDILFFH
jgi:hypothetical protein